MDKCNNIDKIITDVINADREAQEAGKERVESLVTEGDAKRRSIWEKIINKQYDKSITEKMADEEFNKQYKGPDGRQALLANKIEDLLKQNDIRAYVFNEYLLYDIGKHDVWEMAKYKDGMPILETLPVQYLNSLYAKLWNFGMEKDWGSFKYKVGKISFGRPFNLKWNDSSGGYAIIEKAVAQFPSNVNRNVQQFLKFNGKRRDKDGQPYGMNEVYRWGGEVFDLIDSTTQRKMADYHGSRSEAKSYMIEFLTMYLNGWINLDASTKSFEINTEYLQAGGTYTAEARFLTGEYGGQKGKILKTNHTWSKDKKTKTPTTYDMVLEDGTMVNNVDVNDVNAPEKDFVFVWDNPVTIKPYDDYEHGQQYLKKNGYPMDLRVVDFLKGYFPIPQKAVKRMEDLSIMVKGKPKTQYKPAFKGIHEEVYEWAEGVTDEQGKLIVPGERQKTDELLRKAALRWMVDENQKPYDEELVKQALQAVWDVNFEVGPDVSEHLMSIIEDLRFINQFTMFQIAFWDTKPMEKKDAFPIQFVDVKLTHQFRQFKPRLLEEIKKLKDLQAKAKTGKRLFARPIAELESALEHANWALEKGQGISEESIEPGGKLMTQADSVHAKHITNAFDPMEMRTDKDLYPTYLNNLARHFERKHLNAKLMDAIRIVRRDKKLNPQAVEDAILALHGATVGDNTVRAMWAGMDFSSANIERMFKKVRLNIPKDRIDYYGKKVNMHMTAVLLNQFMTAAFNATQAVEKDLHFSHKIHMEMTEYYIEYKNDPGLQQFLQKAGVSAFTDYFSQNLIGEMEALEAGFNQAIPAMQSILKYYKDLRKGINEEKAFDDLFVAFEKAMRMPIKKDELPSFDEAKREMKQMKRMEKLATINKLANWAITKEWKGAKSRGKLVRLKDSLKTEFSFFAATVPKELMGFPTMAGTESTTRSITLLTRAEIHRRMMRYETTLHQLEPTIDKLEEALIKRQDIGPERRSAIKEELKYLKKQRQEYLLLGKMATRELDYDLEKGLYSESSRSVWGKFNGLFGDFGKQRMEQEGVKIKEAYRSLASQWHIENDKTDYRAIFLVLAHFGKGMLPEEVHMALRKEIGLKQQPGGKTKLTFWKQAYVSKDTRQTTNRHSATMQRLFSIWMWTWLYNGVLFAPFGAAATIFPQLTRKIMRKITGSHKLGNANSDIASLIQAPFMILLAYSLYQGGDEEDEEIRDLWDSIVQSIPILGVGGSMIWNVGMGILHIAMTNVEAAWDEFGKTIKTPVPKEFHPLVDEGLEVIKEEIR